MFHAWGLMPDVKICPTGHPVRHDFSFQSNCSIWNHLLQIKLALFIKRKRLHCKITPSKFPVLWITSRGSWLKYQYCFSITFGAKYSNGFKFRMFSLYYYYQIHLRFAQKPWLILIFKVERKAAFRTPVNTWDGALCDNSYCCKGLHRKYSSRSLQLHISKTQRNKKRRNQ